LTVRSVSRRANFEAPFDGTYVALLAVIPAYALATVLWLGYAAATSGLMDRSEDRSLPLKRWAAGTFGLGMAALFVCAGSAGERHRGTIAGASMVAAALVAATLLFTFADEPVRPSRRMQVHPRSLFVRLVYPWCLAPSVFFTVVVSGIVLLSIPVLAGASPRLEVDALWAVACLSALGGFMGYVAAHRGGERARRAGLIAAIGLTFLVAILRDRSGDPTWIDAICPLWLVCDRGADAQRILFGSVIAWAAVASVALGSMLRAVRAPRGIES
jgi:hypothetical protein